MAMTSMAITHEEPILSKLDRLDNMVRELEQIRGGSIRSSSPQKSSCELSTPSSGTLTSDGHVSSIDDFSPKSLEKHCRPINHVVLETEVKGTLVERLARVEDRVLKMEKELIQAEKNKEESVQKKSRKGLKQLVKRCVGGGKNKA